MTFKQIKSAWSDEKLKQLVEMHRDGAMLDEIYAAFPERKPKQIEDKMVRIGLSLKGRRSNG